jgi:hypothetical protein
MKPREQRLLDALEALPRTAFKGKVWRVVREGRDPAQCSAAGGRWDDGSFEVLHTACERDGALCEMYFHLLRGQPVFPSKLRFTLFELEVQTAATLSLPGLPNLTALGLDISRYSQLSYAERVQEYPSTQQLGEAAHFLDFDSLNVPSARYAGQNLVLFCARLAPDAINVTHNHGLIEWRGWEELQNH